MGKLQDIIESEELTKDTMKLKEYNDKKDIDKIINEFRYEFISKYDQNSEYGIEIISAIYKYTEELKAKLHN